MFALRTISGSNFAESVIHVSTFRRSRECGWREEAEARTRTTLSAWRGGGGRDRTDSGRSDKGVAIFVWTPRKAVTRVESQIKGESEKETDALVADDDDSVSYLVRIVAWHRAGPRSQTRNSRSTDDREDDRREETEEEGEIRLCLVENSPLMSRQYDIPRLGLFPLRITARYPSIKRLMRVVSELSGNYSVLFEAVNHEEIMKIIGSAWFK